MRYRSVGLLALATASLPPLVRPAAAGDAEKRPRPITIVAGPMILPKETPYRVDLRPEENDKETVRTTDEGKVAEVADDGMTLTVTSERRCCVSKSPYASVPLLNRMRSTDHVWKAG